MQEPDPTTGGHAPLKPAPSPARRDLLRRGVRLEGFSVAYNVAEGVVAVIVGWSAGSIALIGFGMDSTIETLSALAVFLRLLEELRGRDLDAHIFTERRAERIVGGTLFALCLYILVQSIRTLVLQRPPEETTIGLVLAVLSILIMPFLVVAKRRLGRALGSRALVADAAETLICTYLSVALLAGLALNALFGWWWADPAAALVMIPFILREGWEAWVGEDEG